MGNQLSRKKALYLILAMQCMSQTRKAITKYICSNMFFPEPWALIYTVVVVIGLETFQKNLPTGLYNFLTFASRYISLRNSFSQVALHIVLLGLVNWANGQLSWCADRKKLTNSLDWSILKIYTIAKNQHFFKKFCFIT